VRNIERFAKIRVLEMPVQDAIKNPESIFAKLG
jgi:fructose-specific phosphotransferase system component IIB